MVGAGSDIEPIGQCIGCGYALIERGKAACPECGRGYDEGDDATFDTPLSRFRRQRPRLLACWALLNTLLLVAVGCYLFAGPVRHALDGVARFDAYKILIQGLIVAIPAAWALLLTAQTRLVRAQLGWGSALGYLVLIVVLTPFLVGPVAVPLQVIGDVRRALKRRDARFD